MVKLIGILLATCGIVLLAFGVSQSPEVSETVNNLVHHVPFERPTLILGLGALATAVGLGIAVARGRSPRDHRV